ncbi:MAG TPA: sugar transferase [Candidatus Limnocylindria bacterium]|nr:sugar transferase [Candidatus Limnocylindria bacterium]
MIALEAQKLKLPVPPGTGPRRRLRPDGSVARWWQVVVAAVGLVVLLPVSAVIAIAIKLTSRGPILYRGQRVGRNMEPFSIYKFRTLLVDAESRIGARLLTPGDPLYTPIGRFLKRTKLDEIPQLWNVVKGDMNLVGPRPIRPVFLATSLKEIRDYGLRFVVRPGMTGLAQLRGGYFTHPRDKLRYDLLYIANRTPWLDLKLVLATFVKLVNRWLTLGLLLALVFLSASFLPGLFRGPVHVSFGGFNLSIFEAVGLLAAVALLARQIPSHRLYLYRTPTNRPILAFILFCVLAGLTAGDLVPRVRDAAYFTATGFLLVFLVVSGDISRTFVRNATRVVALAAVAMALVGILQVVVDAQAGRVGAHAAEGLPRLESTLGNPVVLSAYLVLGVPLVVLEMLCARRREEREFWLIATTLVFVGVLLSQTRLALLALWLTGAIFAWGVSRRAFRLVVGAAFGFLALLVATGTFRFQAADLGKELGRRASVAVAVLSETVASPRGLVGTLPGKGAESEVMVPGPRGGEPREVANENMHLTLMQRTGLIGWAIMMWVIGAALAAIGRASGRMHDRRLSLTLWAIFSAGVGFLVSMVNLNAFYNPTLQVLFWGLLGIGMAIATHFGGQRPTFNVIYRFGQGE